MKKKVENNLSAKFNLKNLKNDCEIKLMNVVIVSFLAVSFGIYGFPELIRIYQKMQLENGNVEFKNYELENKNQEKIQTENLVILDQVLENLSKELKYQDKITIIKYLGEQIISLKNGDIFQVSGLAFDTELTELQFLEVQKNLAEKDLVLILAYELNNKKIWIIGRNVENPEIP